MTAANRNILIIGLDQDLRNALTALLRAKVYTVHQVQTGEEGLAAIQREVFGAVLLEGTLSDIDGGEVLNILVEENPMLPVIILTTSVKVGSYKANEFMARGAFGIVPMPLDQSGLLRVIAEAMRPRTQPWVRPLMP
jgi:DNA-binding NtrC family response regulator